MTLDNYAKILSSTIGWPLTDKDLIVIGERVNNLQRAFNVREGVRRSDDMLPRRIREMPRFGRWAKPEAAIVHYEEMLDEYYRERGWDRDGIPTVDKLSELGLDDVAAGLREMGLIGN
jgi:aldehyde:ferredoxin oxidoreductase